MEYLIIAFKIYYVTKTTLMAKTTKTISALPIATNHEGRWISAFENMKDVVMIVDSNMLIQSINRVDHGYTKEQVIGVPIYYFIPADKADEMKENIKVLFESGTPFEVEHYVSGPDGKDAWYYGVYSPIIGANGKVEEFMIITRNITAIKYAEHNVLSAMIEGQEEERKRISAELHDGLGQLLGAINLNLLHLETDAKKSSTAKLNKTLHTIRELLVMAGSELRSISHNLAPPLLVELGLVKALEEYCKSAGKDYKVKIAFKARNMKNKLEGSLKLAVFRIVQELIYNSIKHSNSKNMEVEVERNATHLILTVSDMGKGFDPAKHSNGLGLQNIKTRAQVHNGKVKIYSKPGKGAVVQVFIPVA